jgi:hypothetical protein
MQFQQVVRKVGTADPHSRVRGGSSESNDAERQDFFKRDGVETGCPRPSCHSGVINMSNSRRASWRPLRPWYEERERMLCNTVHVLH